MSQMTEEEKAAQEAAAEEESKATDAEATEEQSEDEGEAKDSENTIDYDQELKKERDARERAERALAEQRFKLSEQKRKQQDDDEEDEQDPDSKPLTAKQLQVILANEREQTEKRLQQTQIEQIAKALSGSDAEAQLIVEIYKNRSFPPHLTLSEQVEEAYAIANRKKLIGERNEALRALRGKETVNTNTATTHHEPSQVGEPKLSPQDAQAFKAAGLVWNGTKRRFEKKLGNGSILVRDPKTKQTYLLKS